jgi:hypothetical protein
LSQANVGVDALHHSLKRSEKGDKELVPQLCIASKMGFTLSVGGESPRPGRRYGCARSTPAPRRLRSLSAGQSSGLLLPKVIRCCPQQAQNFYYL